MLSADAALYDQYRHPTSSVVVAMEALRLARKATEALPLLRRPMEALRLVTTLGRTGEIGVEQDLRKILGRFRTDVVGGFRRENEHFALAADRRWLVCETEQKRIALYNLDAPGGFEPVAYLDAPPSEVRAVEVHPEGKFVATVGKDGSAYLWRSSGAGQPWTANTLTTGDASAPRSSWTRQICWSPSRVLAARPRHRPRNHAVPDRSPRDRPEANPPWARETRAVRPLHSGRIAADHRVLGLGGPGRARMGPVGCRPVSVRPVPCSAQRPNPGRGPYRRRPLACRWR